MRVELLNVNRSYQGVALIIGLVWFLSLPLDCAWAQRKLDLHELSDMFDRRTERAFDGGRKTGPSRVDSFVLRGLASPLLSVARDKTGALYLLYPSYRQTNLIKLSKSLTKIWDQKIPIRMEPTDAYSSGRLAINSSGDVFVAFQVKREGDSNCLFAKVAEQGDFLWSKELAGCRAPVIGVAKSGLWALAVATGKFKRRKKVWEPLEFPEGSHVLLGFSGDSTLKVVKKTPLLGEPAGIAEGSSGSVVCASNEEESGKIASFSAEGEFLNLLVVGGGKLEAAYPVGRSVLIYGSYTGRATLRQGPLLRVVDELGDEATTERSSLFVVVNSDGTLRVVGELEGTVSEKRDPIQVLGDGSLAFFSSGLGLDSNTYDFDMRRERHSRLGRITEPVFWWKFDENLKPGVAGVFAGEGLPDASENLRGAFVSEIGLAKFTVSLDNSSRKSPGHVITGELFRSESPFADSNRRNYLSDDGGSRDRNRLPPVSAWLNKPLLVRDVKLVEVRGFDHGFANSLSLIGGLSAKDEGFTVMDYRTTIACFNAKGLKHLLPFCKSRSSDWLSLGLAEVADQKIIGSHMAVALAPFKDDSIPHSRQELTQENVVLKFILRDKGEKLVRLPSLRCRDMGAYFYIDENLDLYHARREQNSCGPVNLDPHVALTADFRLPRLPVD
jgi:outer membrane protein assembly factor BamB